MRWVYPQDSHQTFESATFVLGSVPPGATLHLNGQPVPVSPEGFFAQKVPLTPGENALTLTASNGSTLTRRIQRHQPQAPPQSLVLLAPQQPVRLTVGEALTVTVLAPPGQTVTLTVPGQPPVPLTPKGKSGFVDNREAVFVELHQTQALIPANAYYEGRVPLQTPMTDAVLTVQAPGLTPVNLPPVTVSNALLPATVTKDQAVTRTAPVSGARLTPLLNGAQLLLNGERDGWVRARLGGDTALWVAKTDVAFNTPHPRQIPVMTAKSHPTRWHDLNAVELTLAPLPEPPAHRVITTPQSLALDLFGVVSHCDFIHRQTPWPVSWSQATMDTFRLETQVPVCGFDNRFINNQWHVRIKPWPTEKPVILLDPGHGGTETGSTAPDGVPEKERNLQLARHVGQALTQAGYPVLWTRQTDATVSLTERAAMAERAHLVISLHHNALPDGRDPLQAEGLGVYYYHPFAEPLARHLFQQLPALLNEPAHGLFYDSLAITRIHTAMAVLIEVGFFTHPASYARLRQTHFQQAFARALVQALNGFQAGALL
jgi:N-acetylmuramoyl-L-alanine amidase